MNIPSGNIILIGKALCASSCEIDDALDIVLIKDLAQESLVFGGEEYPFGIYIWDIVQKLLNDGRRAIKLESEVNQSLRNGPHFRLRDVTTDEDTRVCSGNFETGSAEQ